MNDSKTFDNINNTLNSQLNNTSIINNNNNINIVPRVTYTNLEEYKSIILSENKRKSGIYRLNNLLTDKSYVGSSKDLYNRLRAYYSTSNMERIVKKEKSIIYKAILKYGHSKFSLDILEYCEPNNLISREQYYIDLLTPEYNILKTAGSRLGHSPREKTRKAISIALIERSKKYRCNSKENIIKNITTFKLKCGVHVKVFDKLNNLLFEFPSINSAARYFDVSSRAISNIRDRGISYDNYIYKFEDLKIWVYNYNKELINALENKKKVSDLYSIPCTTLSRYIKSGKLYNNEYYFCKNEGKFKSEYIADTCLRRKLSEETKLLISNTLKNRLVKLLPIKVMNIETDTIRFFANNLEAAKYIGTSEGTLGRYKSKGKILLKKYIITNNISNNKSYK